MRNLIKIRGGRMMDLLPGYDVKFDPNGCPTRKLAREKLHELQIKNKNKEKI